MFILCIILICIIVILIYCLKQLKKDYNELDEEYLSEKLYFVRARAKLCMIEYNIRKYKETKANIFTIMRDIVNIIQKEEVIGLLGEGKGEHDDSNSTRE